MKGQYQLDIHRLRLSEHYKDAKHMRRRKLIEWEGGYGNVVCGIKSDQKEGDRRLCLLTSTGVMMIVDCNKNMLVTAWLAAPFQIEKMFGNEDVLNSRVFDKQCLPDDIWKKALFHYKSNMCQVSR